MKKSFFTVALHVAHRVTLSLLITLFIFSCEQEAGILNTSPSAKTDVRLSEMKAKTAGFMGRIAISADGNAHDRDDIASTPMGLAIIAHFGLQDKLVHYDYNSHIWNNASISQKNDMTESALGAASRFNFDEGVFSSAIDAPEQAERSIATAINKSSSRNPLYILVAGPMAVVCEGIRLSNPAKRKFVTVISHSSWNNEHQHDGSCTADGVKQTGVKFDQISDQNANFRTLDWSEYEWLENHADPNLRWVYDRMKTAFDDKADISDAGMVWYLLKNDEQGTPSKLKTFFANSSPEPTP